MTAHQNINLDRDAQDSFELLLAQEELILQAQMLIQRALNEQGISQRELADRLGVGSSYVSQMLGNSAKNLTLKSIARVLFALGEKAEIKLEERQQMPSAEVEVNDEDWSDLWFDHLSSDLWRTAAEPDSSRMKQKRRTGEAQFYSSFDTGLALAA